MPELAEVEIVRRNLVRWWDEPAHEVRLLDDQLLVRGDPETLRELLERRRPILDRRGKYLIARFDEEALVFHFRMTGKIVLSPEPEVRFARLAWSVPAGWLVFKDARRLGQIELFGPGELATYAPLTRMGPEPEDLTGASLRASVARRKRLKDALMDQSVVAGVGNIAISEIFWRLRLPADVETRELSSDQYERLAAELPRYFEELIAREEADEIPYLAEGKTRNPFDVYRREGEACPRCQTPIARAKIGGRSSYFCPTCQARESSVS